jgi:hypothetical protein
VPAVSDAGLVQQLRKAFGIRGDQDIDIGNSISLVCNLKDLDSAPFHQKVGGTFSLQSGPVAAQLAYVGVRNPLTNLPNHRAVIRRMWTFSAGAALFATVKVANSAALDAVLAGPALSVINGSWDSPQLDQPAIRQSLQSYQTTNVAAFGQDGIITVSPGAAVVPTVLEGPWVLAPGNTLFLQAGAVNIGLTGAFYFDEYLLG